jgi:hypothetical protein
MAKKATADFEFLSEINDNGGFEQMTFNTQAIPFIRLLQDISPQLKPSKYIEGAEAGMFFNTVTKQLYAAPLRVIVGKFDRLYLEWHASTRGKLIATHDPAYVEMNPHKFARDNKGVLRNLETSGVVQETYTYYVVLPDFVEEGICIITLSSTNLKEGKRLNRNLTHSVIPNTNKKALPYFMVWSVDSIPASNEKGDWLAIRFSFDSFITPALLENVVEERKSIPNKTVDYTALEYTPDEQADSPY